MAKFLVVDDSRLSRTKLSGILADLGHSVVGEGSDGHEGVKLFSELMPDLVMMDLEMPNLNGIEATERILGMNKDAKVLIVTSIMDKKETLIAMKKGARLVLSKPVSKEDVKSALLQMGY